MIHVRRPSLSSGPHAPSLRDAMRGVFCVAGLAQEALHPIVSVLPEPLRRSFEDGVRAMQSLATDDIAASPDLATITVAGAFLAGQGGRAADAEACARCLGFAWDRLLRDTDHRHGVFFSDAAAVRRLRRLAPRVDGTGAHRVADIEAAMGNSGVIFGLPGTPAARQDEMRRISGTVIGSALIWLLAKRGASIGEELALLEMAHALNRSATAGTAEVSKSASERDAQLRSLAQHL